MKRGTLWVAAGLLSCAEPGPAFTPEPRDASVDASAQDRVAPDLPRPDSQGPVGDRPTDTSDPCALCGPGEVCQARRCLADCRFEAARPCGEGTVCDFLAGRCTAPGMACLLTGTYTNCGRGEFPYRCGPGSRCEAERCVVTEACRRVVCDATNACRGADCMIPGGGVRSVTLEAPPESMAGMSAGVRVRARVEAEALCGLTATFELRGDDALYVSAGNDQAIWRIPLGGAPSRYVMDSSPVSGLAADRTGTLYYARVEEGTIHRVRVTGGTATSERWVGPLPGSGNLARITFGPDGDLYAVRGLGVYRVARDLTVTSVATVESLAGFTTGLVFDRDGALLVAGFWPWVYRIPAGATAIARYVDATPMVPFGTVNPWNEGMALGPDGLVYVGIFPSSSDAGVLYRIEADRAPRRLVGLTDITRGVSGTRFAGIHGLAFGAEGSLYFVNQNTDGDTRRPDGQVLVRRPDGSIALVGSGLNFDWPLGFDGDIVVGQVTLGSVSVPVREGGVAEATLDAPTRPGTYQVRVLVTDPRGGAISSDQGPVVVR
ncbi:MAG: hypothetical protein HY909_06785 [Deltaproteobacteria bacterium]|nr:hypothetical protein [Deltaproteobacteria bacterium]